MKIIALLLSLMVGTLPALANDMSIAGVGGSLHPLRGQHPQVRMVREQVNIDVGQSSYQVRVNFVFHNQGKATTVTMGFPESGGGGDIPNQAESRKSTFLAFSSSVDGRTVRVKRVLLEHREEDYEAVWIKKVTFAAGQTRRVQVDYRTTLGGASGVGYEQLVGYDFTGGNWAGDVDSSILTLHFKQPGDYLVNAMLGDKKVAGKINADGSTFTWRHWQAQGYFLLRFLATAPQWMVNSRYTGEADGLRDFTQLSVPGAPALKDRRLDWFPPAFYDQGITYISLNEFSGDVHDQFPQAHPSLMWNAATRSATLQVQDKKYIFQPGNNTMKIGNSTVPLPAPPMLIRGHDDDMGSKLYIPMAPVILAMGGTYHVNKDAHRYRFELPQVVK